MKEPKEYKLIDKEIYIVDLVMSDDYRVSDARVFSTSKAAQEFAGWILDQPYVNWTVTDIWKIDKIHHSAKSAIHHYEEE